MSNDYQDYILGWKDNMLYSYENWALVENDML